MSVESPDSSMLLIHSCMVIFSFLSKSDVWDEPSTIGHFMLKLRSKAFPSADKTSFDKFDRISDMEDLAITLQFSMNCVTKAV